MLIKALIVDDEKLARDRLRSLLDDFRLNIKIIGEAQDAQTAGQFIEANPVDVIFLDIKMPGMSGIELARDLPPEIYIIFTTAFDKYAIKAFESNTIDYLLKPIEKKRLSKTIEKLVHIGGEGFNKYNQRLHELLQNMEPRTTGKFTVKMGDKAVFLDYNEILFFKAEEKYITVGTCDKEFIVNDTICALESNLPDAIFKRCHRSCIVNLNHVREARKWFAGRYRLIMNDKKETRLPLSRSLKHEFGL